MQVVDGYLGTGDWQSLTKYPLNDIESVDAQLVCKYSATSLLFPSIKVLRPSSTGTVLFSSPLELN